MRVLPLLAGVLLFTPACSLVEGARQDLATMEEQDFRNLVARVEVQALKGGIKLQEAANFSAEDNQLARQVLWSLAQTVVDDDLGNADDVVRALLTRFSDEIGNEQVSSMLQDAVNVIDVTVGQVRLGIDGLLTAREKMLVLALLKGTHDGLVSAAPNN